MTSGARVAVIFGLGYYQIGTPMHGAIPTRLVEPDGYVRMVYCSYGLTPLQGYSRGSGPR